MNTHYAVAMYFGENGWLYVDSDGNGVMGTVDRWVTTDKRNAERFADKLAHEYNARTKAVIVQHSGVRTIK